MSKDQITFWKRNGLELPLRTSPIRFAITKNDGFTSNSWGVRIEKKGDAYVYCRDSMQGQKVSLHTSGKQHISFDKNTLNMKFNDNDRFMNQWWEPKHTGEAIPTLRLLFPTWGLSLNTEQRNETQTVWEKNDVLIPADDKMVTVVSFIIMDDTTRLRKTEGSPPCALFGILRLRPGKSLFVIAGYEPEGDLRGIADAALREIASTTDRKLWEGDEDITICLTGYTVKNCIFMLPLSAQYTPPNG